MTIDLQIEQLREINERLKQRMIKLDELIRLGRYVKDETERLIKENDADKHLLDSSDTSIN